MAKKRRSKFDTIDWIAFILVIIGGLNWGLVGFFNFNLIYALFSTGIIATVTDFLHNNGGNILKLDQHVDTENEIFFMRVEWCLTEFVIPKEKISDYFETLIASKYNMTFRLYFSDYEPRMAIFVSKMTHCLYDILAREQSKEWNVKIPLIISNHKEIEVIARRFGIDFYHIPITKENKAEQEKHQMELLEKYKINFVVLARYMQILTDKITTKYSNKIINIHHSFLPAFPGAKPYHSAFERGVKIIGATAHYVTEELDQGPIIEQEVIRISHKDSLADLKKIAHEHAHRSIMA